MHIQVHSYSRDISPLVTYCFSSLVEIVMIAEAVGNMAMLRGLLSLFGRVCGIHLSIMSDKDQPNYF